MKNDSSSSCMKHMYYSHRETKDEQPTTIVFDLSLLQHQINMPPQFIWPKHEQPCLEQPPPPLSAPPIDLGAFLSGDPLAVSRAISLVNEACKKHGFFLVVNHGIDSNLINEAQKNMDFFFGKPLALKLKAERKPGDLIGGYASSFTNRFSASRLPWKETLSFRYCTFPDHQQPNIVENYVSTMLGEEFKQFGYVK
ncbi:oxygenase [Lithospermum erythrorhizon]|uniref:Oxygenase n=1 Tax=Lithospermum erythrorhizon TaxID=34254 RepID=A0AAV3PHC1_LITER